MRTILFLLRKEFLQIKRNKTILPIIFVVPVIQLVILVFAATMELKNIDILFVDHDKSVFSQELISHFSGAPFYTIVGISESEKQAEELLTSGDIDVAMVIPSDFEKNLVTNKKEKVQLLVDAVNGMAAGVSLGYTNSVIFDFNRKIAPRWSSTESLSTLKQIDIKYRYWYNPELNYKTFMLPGILVILVTLIGMFLSALNFVREKEMGTIEQLNVTPIRKYQFIIAKMIPFWLIALFELAFGLTIGRIFFHLPIEGSVLLLFAFAALYLIAILGIGLFFSTVSNSQQQVMFINFFFMLTFILMSGIFTPVESMPDWAIKLNVINPFAYFMKVIRMILLKGSGFAEVLPEFIKLAVYSVVIMSLSVWKYRKTT